MSKRVRLIGLLALLGVLTALLFGSASARSDSSAGGIRTLRTPTRVTGLAADGSVAAVATACSSGYGVYSLYSWNPGRRSVVSIARPRQRRCYESSTGEGIWEAGIGGPRLAWVHFSGGNYQQASLATASSRKPWSVRFLTGQLDRNTGNMVGAWVGNVHGDGRLLVFNTWSVCESLIDPSSCPKGIPPGQRVYDEKIWRIVGRRKTLILASRGQAGVVAVAAGRILVRRADGSLQLRKADGRLLHTFPFEPKEVRGAVLDASELVVLDRSNGLTWRVYDPASGHEKSALPAVPHAVGQHGQVAADVEHGLLVYTIGRVVHVLRLLRGTWQRLRCLLPLDDPRGGLRWSSHRAENLRGLEPCPRCASGTQRTARMARFGPALGRRRARRRAFLSRPTPVVAGWVADRLRQAPRALRRGRLHRPDRRERHAPGECQPRGRILKRAFLVW